MHAYIFILFYFLDSESDIDSDIENFLYGQAHYSAELKFATKEDSELTLSLLSGKGTSRNFFGPCLMEFSCQWRERDANLPLSRHKKENCCF